MIVLSDGIAPEITPTMKLFNRQSTAWIIATFALTMASAALLSYTGFLPTDPITAATDGFLVAIVYVGFRVLLGYRALRMRAKMNIIEE